MCYNHVSLACEDEFLRSKTRASVAEIAQDFIEFSIVFGERLKIDFIELKSLTKPTLRSIY